MVSEEITFRFDLEEMMRGFPFQLPADPKNPQIPTDLPPEGWDTMDTADFRRATAGCSALYESCVAWQDRELTRHGMKCLYEYRNWRVVPLEGRAAG